MILRAAGLLAPGLPLSRRELGPLVERTLDAMGLAGATLELSLVGDAEIEALNRSFLGLPGPTNVLSFPAGEGAERSEYLGEMAISVETATREAFLYGQDPAEHFLRLLCHGLAHLAGFDHGEAMDALAETGLESALAGFESSMG